MANLSTSDVLNILAHGTIELEGLLPWSSNYAFLAGVCADDVELQAVYKPRRGERPLWDFASDTLCQREQAAFLVSEALGWSLVPPTVLREAQHGVGTIQLFIDHDPERHYFTFEGEPLYRQALQQMVLLDVIINNADRKAGHVLVQQDMEGLFGAPGRIWGIDHGICFHTDPKLRTVIWEFAGSPIAPPELAALHALAAELAEKSSTLREGLRPLLTPDEVRALRRRLERLINRGAFPEPGSGRHYPWPPV